MRKVFTIIWLLSRLVQSSYTTEVLQPQFEKSFADRCTAKKYPFLQQFFEVQNRPTDRYIYFVLHEHGLETAGLGDRIAGLLTAASMAVIYDRKLVIESSSGFEELFAPRNPDIAAGASVSRYFLLIL
jgi:hypothetical protein